MAPDASEIDALRAALAAAEARAAAAAAAEVVAAARERAVLASAEATIASLRLEIEKLRRALYGTRSERKARLLDQLELQLEELEVTATEDDLAAEALRRGARAAAAGAVRKPFPADLPRERVVVPPPACCEACGSGRIAKMGEAVAETLEVIPRRWKVVQTVREKFTCRDCERISQPPAPFHPTPRGWAGPNLLATILFEKFGQHQPLNRRAKRYARERHRHQPLDARRSGRRLRRGARARARRWTTARRRHPGAGARQGQDLHRPALGLRPRRPALRRRRAAGRGYSRDRRGEHPAAHLAGWSGILQADAYAGFGTLYAPDRSPAPVTEALCWAQARRKFFELADIAASARRGAQAPPISPLAREAVTRIDAVFEVERAIIGLHSGARLAARQTEVTPLVADLEAWMRRERAGLSRHAPVAKAMDYMLKRRDGFAGFLADGRACLTNNAAERALRGIALGRKAWLFAGADRGGERAAFMYGLIATAKLNDLDPPAWLADALSRIAGTPASRLDDLLRWNWRPAAGTLAA